MRRSPDARAMEWRTPRAAETRGALAKFAATVSSASTGACTGFPVARAGDAARGFDGANAAADMANGERIDTPGPSPQPLSRRERGSAADYVFISRRSGIRDSGLGIR